MASRSFQAVLERRSGLLHRKVIWQEAVDHLRKFVDTDAAPAKHGIITEGGGMTAPQSSIEAVIVEITDGPLAKILQELEDIDKSEVAENVPEEREEGAQGSPKGRKKARRQPST